MLEQLRGRDIRNEVKEEHGLAIYTAIDAHIRRAIGSMGICDGLGSSFPYFTTDGRGQLVRRGSFETGRAGVQLLYSLLAKSQVLRYYNVDLPPRTSHAHLELTTRIIEAAKQAFQQKFASSDFYVLIYPGSKELLRILPLLEEKQIRYLDYSSLFDSNDPQYQIVGDGHPTPTAYQILAHRLVEDLQLVSDGHGG